MKTLFKTTVLLFIAVFTFQSCSKDYDDIAPPTNLEVQDFIWKGLNYYYLWQANVPNLADDRFANQTELNTFLSGFSKPETLFQSLLYKPSSLFPNPKDAVDRFSWIVSDYRELEQSLQGTSKNNGVDFRLSNKSENSTELIGFVRYIIPGSDAATKDIKRGEVFYGVNGTQLTVNNYENLLYSAAESYTLNFANLTYDSNNNPIISPNGKSLALTKTVLDENPVLINKVITKGGHKIGYLMYNGFYSNYDNQLNAAFGELKSQEVTDLVLDLRYNGGGSVKTATRLASMITKQTTDKIFAKLKWNTKNSNHNINYLFPDNIDSTPINNINMTTVYVLTSKATASASELIINGLNPYITVVQIGDVTYGKNVASITIYDSPDFGPTKRNPNHHYAMQAIVASTVNSVNFGDYLNGFEPIPALKLPERISTLGVLGSETEPLLSTAIGKITGTARMIKQSQREDFKYFTDSKSMNRQNQMYLEEGLKNALK
jgi:carboxyl-terminal processing protease